ncbi:MAG: YidC/Oxa1 family membrane protein insertase, partial [Clostridiales bacterium]|nr:YidC/Oxa1 family membrane protein insertase [Clostridiales bacterium]
MLILPLYIKADELQLKSAEKEKALKPWMDRIKKTFKGDERFMILNAYYKENDYSPADVFKGSFSLLLQVPFFIAAFHMLSGLKIFQGTSFLFGLIKDLSVPD